MKQIRLRPDTVRNLVFGIEDSLVSTIGFISGIAVAGIDKKTILITGAVLILVEASSMAIGVLMSDNSVEESIEHRAVSYVSSEWGAFVMFVSYTLSGILVVFPYIFIAVERAFGLAILLAGIELFALGMFSGRVAGISPWKKGLLTTLLGGLAILIGVCIGTLFK